MISPSSAGPAPRDLRKRQRHNNWRWSATIAAIWLTFVALHAFPLLYFSVSACAYWFLRDSGVSNYLSLYKIGIGPTHYRSVSVAYGFVAVLHLWVILRMISSSIRQQRFVFSDTLHISRGTTSRNITYTIRQVVVAVYITLFSPTGLLGVSGPCFDLVLLAREMLETLLQTVQAYRMSLYLSRPSLNRLYVALLVLNCWIMALVHVLFHRSSTSRYFASLLCDLVLDVASSIGVPFALAVIYSKDADTNSSSLFGLKWFEDIWLANASSEFQLILVASWADLASKMFFSISMVGTLNTIKRFVDAALDRTEEVAWRQRWNSIVPDTKHERSRQTHSLTLQVLNISSNAVKNHPVLKKALKIVFAVWGMAILVFHLVAESNPHIAGCVMQVRPWGVSRPSCNLMLINCYSDKIFGSELEIHERLTSLYPPALGKIVIRHCSSLQIPPIIQSYSSLNIIKIYNSTITRWDLDAALTKTTHPTISILMMTRVNTSDGLLPVGLQSPDFPQSLFILGFVVTNIRELPDDLALKWPSHAIIHFDTAKFTHIPAPLLRLSPRTLIFPANPIEQVSSEIFELQGLENIDLRETLITDLPDNVTRPSPSLTSINLDGTNVSSFPAWVDEWLTFPGDLLFTERISAARSPYCTERDRIFAGEQSGFTMNSTESSSRLLDASKDNWEYLKRGVACTATFMYRYPLAMEDFFSKVS